MYHINRIIIVVLLSIVLAGCSGVKKLDIFTNAVEKQPLNLPKPTPLQMEQIKWIIITSANAEEVFKKLEAAGIDPVLYGLTDTDYELIAKNFANIRNKLKESNDILDRYKKYYEADLQPKESSPKK
jgi:hypothetical protein|tara:strand:- start:7045 stop:7425 length:381 start_codon:yes stop_codon:yes gene_type:complete